MITENLGKIAITPKGQWVAGTYERLDMVTDAGSSYISLKDNNVSALNTADWMLVAGKGDAFLYEDFTPAQLEALKGDDGESAYEIWLLLGNVGTEQDFIDSLAAGGVDLTSYLKITDATNTYQPKGNYLESETDPTVPDWAKEASKPTYGVNEITGLDTALSGKVDNERVLTDVPANAKFTDTIYTHPATHEATIITQDATHRFVTDTEKTTWSGKADTIHNHDDRYYTEGEIDTIKNDLLNLIYAGL